MESSDEQTALRYMAWGFEIQPNGVVRDPYTGAEVDCLSSLAGSSALDAIGVNGPGRE